MYCGFIIRILMFDSAPSLISATHIQNEDGSLILLSGRNSDQRRGIAKRLLAPDRLTLTPERGSKRVHRHLRNGDILLLNRQPTLHRPSIMAMKVSGCGRGCGLMGWGRFVLGDYVAQWCVYLGVSCY